MPPALAIRDYVLDLDEPRSPSEKQWAQMSAEERKRVLDTLPSELPESLCSPEGDAHRKAKTGAIDALERQFRRIGRKIYLSSELGVFYPNEPRFAPDVLAVLDAEPGERSSWVVVNEGKGLDLVLEVHVAGHARKDRELNVARYARLGIREYFIFDRDRRRIEGHRLPSPEARVYRPILPQRGYYASQVLGLDLALEDDRLRFYYGDVALAEADEVIGKLGSMMNNLLLAKEEAERSKEEAERSKQETERSKQEAEVRAVELQQKLADALAELEHLRKP